MGRAAGMHTDVSELEGRLLEGLEMAVQLFEREAAVVRQDLVLTLLSNISGVEKERELFDPICTESLAAVGELCNKLVVKMEQVEQAVVENQRPV